MEALHGHIAGALVFLVPLAAWPGLPEASAVKELLLVMGALLLVALRLVGARPASGGAGRREAALVATGLFALWASASWLLTGRSEEGLLPLVRLWALVGLFGAVSAGPRRRGPWRRTLPAAALLVALLCLGEWAGLRPFDGIGRSWAPRSRGPFVHPNLCGTFLAVALPWLLDGISRRRTRWPGLAALALLGLAIATTLSRGALVVAATALAVWFLQGTHRPGRRSLVALLLASVTVPVLVAGILGLTSPEALRTHLLRGAALRHRLLQWRGALRGLGDAPLRGQGWGRFPEVFAANAPDAVAALPLHAGVRTLHAHQEYLEIAVELGLPGLALFLAPLILLLPSYGTRGTGQERAARAVVAALCVSGLGSVSLRHPTALLMLWFHLGLLARPRGKDRRGDGPSPVAPVALALFRIGAVAALATLLVVLAAGVRRIGAGILCERAEEAYGADLITGGRIWAGRASRLHPPSARAAYLDAYGLCRQGRWKDAQDVYSDLRARRPAFGDVDHHLGLCLLRRGRPRKALPLLRGALRRRPWDRAFRRDLVEALLAAGRDREALEEAEGLGGPEETSFVDTALLAEALRRTGRPAEALEAARRSIDLAPNHLSALWTAHDACMALDRRDEALVFAHRAMSASPPGGIEGGRARSVEALAGDEDRPSRLPQAFRADCIGRARLARGRFDEAAAAFRAAVDLAPRSPAPWLGLADCAAFRGDDGRAAGLLERLLEDHPDLRPAWDRLEAIARRTERHELVARVARWRAGWRSALPLDVLLGRRLLVLGLTPRADATGALDVDVAAELVAPVDDFLRLDLQLRRGEALVGSTPLEPALRHGRPGQRRRFRGRLQAVEGPREGLVVAIMASLRRDGKPERLLPPEGRGPLPMLVVAPLEALLAGR